ncbi:serine/threonine protein kinase [Actinoplanes lobatus]|uniref:non-specific serine/threonine protein kinase n=2 Tax=Actinoplanes lobatus TaxID=113568 RepID=A0A7W7HAR1_9ACTN|nr:serine/threonine-protein kinase [Actinoplanes lobatus]MBB4747144.1 serine/threonine protein kinase [Actinoplanes lobatus]
MSSSPPLVVADRYRLVAPLGQGGMGRVWRAADVVLHREVAIKELVPPPGLTPAERQEMRERSLREARAIARLNNINVVRVFDVLSTDADPWIVMEYVPSRSLQDTLAADGPFNPLRTAEIGLGVLNALRAAHRNGVVHRDVKPGNVLLGADGRVVLTDFGLATVPGDPNVTRTGLVLGSPAYIAPERARDGTAGPAADLWSLGATLFAAVEGQSPFARPSAIATLAALATENVPVSRNAGPLKPVLNGLLRKDPAHRINAEEAERLLNRASGRRSKITFPMSPTMRRPGVGRERPSLPSGPGGPPVLPGSGWGTATGSAPVVPNPRPPVAQPPAADGRQPHRPAVQPQQPATPFAQGKAQVGGQVPPVGRDGKPLDATRLDTPPVRDSSSGTRQAPPTAPQSGPADTPSAMASGSAPTNALRTGFTAADVAANRRKQAAPEHERSLAQATAGYPVVTPRTEAPAAGQAETPAVEASPVTGPEAAAKAATSTEPEAATSADAGSEPDAATSDETAGPVTADDTGSESKAASEATTDADAGPEESPAEAETAIGTEAKDEPAAEADTPAEAVEETAPPVPEEKTTLLAPAAKAGPAVEEMTSVLAAPAEEKTTMLALDDDRTSVVSVPPRRRPVTDATRVGDGAPVPEFARPSRPAWTPMQLRPAVRRTGGVTIFGTTLTRRQAAIGLGIVMTFVLLVGIILVQAFGSDDDDKKVPQAGASAATQQSGGKQSPDKSTPASQTPSSSPTAAGLPDGWRLYRGSGYTLPVPDNARNEGGAAGGGRTFGWGKSRQIRLDIVPTGVDPMEYQEGDNTGGYDEVGPTRLEYKGYQAVDLEYFRAISSGAQHVVRRYMLVGDKMYVLTWYTEDQDWEKAKPDLESIYEGFEPRK